MKRMIMAMVLLLVAGLLLAGCARTRSVKEDETEIDLGDGYREDRTDPDASKAIESRWIIAFDCRFSTVDDGEPGEIGNHIYHLYAKMDDGAIKGSYEVEDTGEEIGFAESHEFLENVLELVDRYDLAQFNGHWVSVAGLPGDYGVDMDIVYASGEHLRVYDNEECVLPKEFLQEIVSLFQNSLPASVS